MPRTNLLRVFSGIALLGVLIVLPSCTCPRGQVCRAPDPPDQTPGVDPPGGPLIVVDPQPNFAERWTIASASAKCRDYSADHFLNEVWFHKVRKFEADVILIPNGNPVTAKIHKMVGVFKRNGIDYTITINAVTTIGSKNPSLHYTLAGGAYGSGVSLTPTLREEGSPPAHDSTLLREEFCGDQVDIEVWGTHNNNAFNEKLEHADEEMRLKAKW